MSRTMRRRKRWWKKNIKQILIGSFLGAVLIALLVFVNIQPNTPLAPEPSATNDDDAKNKERRDEPKSLDDGAENSTVFADFSKMKDWSPSAQGFLSSNPVAETGQAFGIRSDEIADSGIGIRDGKFEADSTTYLEAKAGAPISRIGAEFSLNDESGKRAGRGTLALIEWMDGGAVNNRLNSTWGRTVAHVTINHRYVRLDYQHDYPHGDAAVYNVGDSLGDGTWALQTPLPQDGTRIIADMTIDREAGEVILNLSANGSTQTVRMEYPKYVKELPEINYPAGLDYAPKDDDYFACWEPFYRDTENDSLVSIHRVWADVS